MTKWTQQQNRAINEDGNLLVAAAAGAGKTAVLTARIVEKIRAGTPVRALLVATFTKAAAGEMKKRVTRELQRSANEEKDAALCERLNVAAEQMQNASVSTLHAFCMQVLRRHFYEAELDPSFRVADEAEAAILFEDALEELFEEKAESPEFVQLCDLLGGEEKLSSAIRLIYAFMQAQPKPEEWLRKAAEDYDTDEEKLKSSLLLKCALAAAKRDLLAEIEETEGVCDSIETLFPEAALFGRREAEACRAIAGCADYESYALALSEQKFATLSGFPRGTAEADKKAFKDARTALKDKIKAQKQLFSRTLFEEAEKMRGLYPVLCELEKSVLAVKNAYTAAKRARGMIDYSDMEHICLSLLSRDEIKEEYRRRFSYIFVDEYQDSNRVQEAILLAVKREDNLFMVGDVKQSIYRFRQAEPALFMEKYAEPSNFQGRVIDLNSNFRSAGAVIGAVNSVFSRIMSREFGGMEYDERASLKLGREDGSSGSAELHVLSCAGGDEEFEAAEAEALFAAEKIKSIMETERYFDPKLKREREYRFSDFAILHRSPKNVAESMTRILAAHGVPAYAELTGGYFEAVEVQVFMNLLRIIDNRRQDIPLLSVMRSMIGGFSDNELAQLRLSAEAAQGGEWLDILLAASRGEGELNKKTAAFLDKLDEWHIESTLVGVSELCGKLLDESGYGEYCAALPGGRIRKANLEALLARAQSYEDGAARSLSSFIAFMDRIKNTDKMGAASALGAEVVRFLSTHKSKGLEFPVVIVAGLSKQFNIQEKREDVAVNAKLGIGLRIRRDRRRVDTLARQAILDENSLSALEEEARILYVAMTRAQEKLIMLFAKKDAVSTISKRARPLSPAACAHVKSAGEWILSSALSMPEGNPLREAAALALMGESEEESGLFCEFHALSGAREAIAKREALSALHERASLAKTEKFDGLLGWRYPHMADTQIPGKLSVSELIGNFAGLRQYPDFIAERRELQAADRGSAAHLVMETIPLEAQTEKSVLSHLESLIESGRMNRAQADAVNTGRIVAFFDSPLGRRMCASECVERERKFNYRAPASEIIDAPTDEPMLIQGVIDCCFIENGEWVVVDYKTDRIPPGVSAREAAQKHKRQLDIYASALAALTGRKVKASYIYLLSSGESVEL